MRHLFLSSLGIVAALWFIAGCGSSGSSTTQADNSNAVAPSAATRPIPPDCIFAKVKMGEELDQVFRDIGQPTFFSNPYQTGKAFIPFHYGGGDDLRRAAHYKGVGIITFGNDSAYTSGYSVVDISYDPNEPGY
ncbi:MAG: hypothetical protein ABSD28_06055 [Tepidisphaeraceae bacterium]|jgi:hypothetical protein